MKRPGILIGAATAALSLLGASASADAYQFIKSGDPVAAATVDSHAAASSGTALETATCVAQAASVSLEARFQTYDESDGIALRSDKPLATFIIMR
jgi:hypothetical protein